MRYPKTLPPLAALLLLSACTVSPPRYNGPPPPGPHPHYRRPLEERRPWHHLRQTGVGEGEPRRQSAVFAGRSMLDSRLKS